MSHVARYQARVKNVRKELVGQAVRNLVAELNYTGSTQERGWNRVRQVDFAFQPKGLKYGDIGLTVRHDGTLEVTHETMDREEIVNRAVQMVEREYLKLALAAAAQSLGYQVAEAHHNTAKGGFYLRVVQGPYQITFFQGPDGKLHTDYQRFTGELCNEVARRLMLVLKSGGIDLDLQQYRRKEGDQLEAESEETARLWQLLQEPGPCG